MAQNQGSVPARKIEFLSRHQFPDGFVLGTSSSSFQYEGEPGGRGESIWDTYLKEKHPDVVEKEKALDAVLHFDRYKEDVRIMKQMGVDSHRFSISWPRVLPNGRRTKGPNGEEQGVNKSGVRFYNDLINELITNEIEPVVCLFHWDFPQTLETEYLGFLSHKVVCDFRDYADLCFREFGDRVKKWLTFNETWTYSMGGYLMGTTAPGRGTNNRAIRSTLENVLPASKASKCDRIRLPSQGVPYREIYTVTHNQLLAHAAAVQLYREKYKNTQKGEIGIILVSMWALPYTCTKADRDAALRVMDFMLGWLMDPLIFGDYPDSMRRLVKDRLPKFYPCQANSVKNSFDFIGLNYYTSNYAQNYPSYCRKAWNLDSEAICHTEKNRQPIGERGASTWLYVYPEGMKELLLYIKTKYNNPPIYITENGIDEVNEKERPFWDCFCDYHRISYHFEHLLAIKEAINQGANVKGYYAWSLLDNLEGADGFKHRFGINYVDYEDNYKRFPKMSATWFKFLLQKSSKK